MSRKSKISKIEITAARLRYQGASIQVHAHECATQVRRINPAGRMTAGFASGLVVGYASRRMRSTLPAFAFRAIRLVRLYHGLSFD